MTIMNERVTGSREEYRFDAAKAKRLLAYLGAVRASRRIVLWNRQGIQVMDRDVSRVFTYSEVAALVDAESLQLDGELLTQLLKGVKRGQVGRLHDCENGSLGWIDPDGYLTRLSLPVLSGHPNMWVTRMREGGSTRVDVPWGHVPALVHSAGTDDTIPVLTHVLVGDGFACSTDRYRLTIVGEIPWEMTGVQIPSTFLTAALKLGADRVGVCVRDGAVLDFEDRANSTLIDDCVVVPLGDGWCASRVGTGDYPRMHGIVESCSGDFPVIMTVDPVCSPVDTLKSAAKLADKETPIHLSRTGATIRRNGERTTVPWPVIVDRWPVIVDRDDDYVLAVNPTFLREAISAMGDNVITIRQEIQGKPLVFTREAGDITIILMPVRVSE